MKNSRFYLVLTFVVVFRFIFAGSTQGHSFSGRDSQASSGQASQMPAADAAPEGRLTKIDPRMVCMVTNHAFDEPQIPIKIKGKTYYGCCEMCKNMLAKDRKQRSAIDPVSKRKVDKAAAVVGVGTNKGILYFENETNLERYNASLNR
jgi:YHS domain-containing protein